jgi:two-component system, LytTR family, sensor kinase
MLLMSGNTAENTAASSATKMAADDPSRFLSFWRLQIVGGLCLYVVVLVACIPDLFKKPGMFRGNSIVVAAIFLGSFLMHPICRALLRSSPTWLSYGLKTSFWSTIVGTLAAVVSTLVALNFRQFDWPDLAGNSVQCAVVIYLWCILYFSIKQWQQMLRERERMLRAESEAREARLSALRYQLNPHFLFNSLNAASTLVLEGDAAGATRMLSQIGDLLRTTLDSNALPEMPLVQELAFIDQYLAIEQTRLGSRLRVERNLSEDTLDAVVPGMLLQPLVENAVRHGVAPLVEGGTICLESKIVGNRLQISIANSGPRRGDRSGSRSNGSFARNGGFDGSSGKAGGIGLKNTEERLKTLYGGDHRFTLRWPDGGGCEATIEIPLIKSAHGVEELACAR